MTEADRNAEKDALRAEQERFKVLCETAYARLSETRGGIRVFLKKHVFRWEDDALKIIDDSTVDSWFYDPPKLPATTLVLTSVAMALRFNETERMNAFAWCGFKDLYVKDLHAALLLYFLRFKPTRFQDDYVTEYHKWHARVETYVETEKATLISSSNNTRTIQKSMLACDENGYVQWLTELLPTFKETEHERYKCYLSAVERRKESNKIPWRKYHTLASWKTSHGNIKKGEEVSLPTLLALCVRFRFTPQECLQILKHHGEDVTKQKHPTPAENQCKAALLKSYTSAAANDAQYWQQMEQVWQACGTETDGVRDLFLFGVDGTEAKVYNPHTTKRVDGKNPTLDCTVRKRYMKAFADQILAAIDNPPEDTDGLPWADIDATFYCENTTICWSVPNSLNAPYQPMGGSSANRLLYMYAAQVYTAVTRHYFCRDGYNAAYLQQQASGITDALVQMLDEILANLDTPNHRPEQAKQKIRAIANALT
ncbi:MAG: hypothetical protein LBN05_02625 [Oscillospiraceae bacterium]|jgi:hypothetical protein|nr:hypothetical protein [Oscillospiraceae bacterium]